MKTPRRACSGPLGDLLGLAAPHGGDGLAHQRDVGRLVRPAAVRHRREERAVGLDQEPVERAPSATASRTSLAFLNVTMPLNDTYMPALEAPLEPRRGRR